MSLTDDHTLLPYFSRLPPRKPDDNSQHNNQQNHQRPKLPAALQEQTAQTEDERQGVKNQDRPSLPQTESQQAMM